MKLLGVGFDILAPVEVRFLSISGEYDSTYRPYFDATAPSLSIRCGVLGNTCCICLPAWINSYAISLACLSAMSKQASSSIANNMHIYVDTFYGSYKDGTEPGSRDCRWLASLFFVVCISILVVYGYSPNIIIFFTIGFMVLLVLCILFMVVQPFKKNSRHNFLT